MSDNTNIVIRLIKNTAFLGYNGDDDKMAEAIQAIEQLAGKLNSWRKRVMHTMEDIDLSYSSGYEAGAKDYKEQRDLVLQENAELVGKIEQLKSDYKILYEMAKVNEDLCAKARERDAAVADLKQNNKCRICKHKKENIQDCQYYSSCGLAYIHFEWRGIDE